MRVLMFGWEFPPHISGGLGTACFGLTQALVKKNTEVIFVLPCTSNGKETQSPIRLLPASGTPVPHAVLSHLRATMDTVWHDKLTVHMVNSLLFPYATPESYAEKLQHSNASHTTRYQRVQASAYSPAYTLKGGYGKNLLDEVYHFSQMATVIAMREQFDVIHVHDWMTYPAGILARQLTGKPLVAHIHATEYDRSGTSINEFVANIERVGLNAADRVIAVSHLTKNMVMEHYGVPADKISVVHNAVARHDVKNQYTIPPRLEHEKRVLFLGRVTFQKGPDYFIEAAHMVLERIKNVRFFMAGSGD
ncbi:MAG: glycosyltransferase family 4 protein, partial [Desulfovibrionaceae bacterium]